MADHCSFCNTRRPEGGTNILVLGTGVNAQWLEFCPECGDEEMFRNGETGEEITVRELFDRSKEKEMVNA